MDAREWFDQMLAQAQGSPTFVADEMALQVVADIHQAMLRKGLSRKDLAARVGVSPAFVSQVLNGKPNMTLLTLAKFALALELECEVRLSPKQEPATEAVARRPRAKRPSGPRKAAAAAVAAAAR